MRLRARHATRFGTPPAHSSPQAATPIATVTSPTYTDTSHIGDPMVNYFYTLATVNRCSQGPCASAASAEVGEFDFGMIPGQ